MFETVEMKKSKSSRESSSLSWVRVAIAYLVLIFYTSAANAQCAMCRAVLESNGENTLAEGINDGIVYLMAIPYLVVGVLFYFIYRKMKA